MALTTAELQAALVAKQQAEAANVVALIDSIVEGRIGLVDVDLGELESKIIALNELLDGDANTEGFQAFQSLVARMVDVETANTEQATAITNLQNLVTSTATTTNERIDQVELDGVTSRNALGDRVTTLEGNATAATTARLLKDNEHDSKIASNESAIANTAGALEQEAIARADADTANANAVGVERGRVDALTTQAGSFASRTELSAVGVASGQSFINTLWAGRTRPAGLPNTDGSVSA